MKDNMDDILRGSLCFKGERGLSAYEIAKQHGFNGTEEEWLASLSNDTGWIDVDTSDSVGTCKDVQIRKIGKIVRLRGTITGLTDENITAVLFTLPNGFAPDVTSLDLVCAMHDNTRYQRTAFVRIYNNGTNSLVQLEGYDTESSTSNIINLDNLSYFAE